MKRSDFPSLSEIYSKIVNTLVLTFHVSAQLGVLCYDNEPIVEDPNVPKVASCVIFDVKEKHYAVYGQYEAITNEALQALYDKFWKKSEPTIQPTKNKNGGFLFKDYEQFNSLCPLTNILQYLINI